MMFSQPTLSRSLGHAADQIFEYGNFIEPAEYASVSTQNWGLCFMARKFFHFHFPPPLELIEVVVVAIIITEGILIIVHSFHHHRRRNMRIFNYNFLSFAHNSFLLLFVRLLSRLNYEQAAVFLVK
jgi:hypothetical protein